MEELNVESRTLSTVDPLSLDFKVMVKFDRPFKREWMRCLGPNRTPVRETLSMDVVLYDQEVDFQNLILNSASFSVPLAV